MRRNSRGIACLSPDSTALTSEVKPSSSVVAPTASSAVASSATGECGDASH
jgi:hypothetical protein